MISDPASTSSASTTSTGERAPESAAPAWRYHAFLSYSHRADRQLARRFHSDLERFAGRWPWSRARRVFRDEANLAATPELWASIVEAMDASGRFILLASPESAGSVWVPREIAHFCERRGVTEVCIALTKGTTPFTDPVDEDPAEHALSDLAMERLAGREPLIVDLRPYRDASRRVRRSREYLEKVAAVAAFISRTDKDALFSEHILRQRRYIGLLCLVIAAIAASLLFAVFQFVEQKAATRLAEKRARIALSRQFAAQAHVHAGQPQAAVRHALQAIDATVSAGEPVTHAAEQALRDALAQISGDAVVGHRAPVAAMALSPDGRRLLTGASDGAALWTLDPNGIPAQPRWLHRGSGVREVGFAGELAVIASRDHRASAWGPGTSAPAIAELDDDVYRMVVGPRGAWIALVTENGGLHVWSPARAAHRDLEPRLHVTGVVFSRDERWLVAYSNRETGSDQSSIAAAPKIALVYDLEHVESPPLILDGHSGRVSSVAAAPEPLAPSQFVTASADGRVLLWDVAAAGSQPRVMLSGSAFDAEFDAVALSPDGGWLVAGEHRGRALAVRIDRSGAPSAAVFVLDGHGIAVKVLAMCAGSRYLVTAGAQDPDAQLWDLSAGDPSTTRRVLRGHLARIEEVRFTPDCRQLLTTSADRTMRVWPLDEADPTRSAVLAGHGDAIGVLAVTLDSARVFAASGPVQDSIPVDPWIRTWQLRSVQSSTYPVTCNVPGGAYTAVVSRDARRLAISDRSRRLTYFELFPEPARCSRGVPLGAMNDNLTASVFRGDGRELVVVAEDGEVATWTLASQPRRARLAAHRYALVHAALSPDERAIAGGDNENGGAIWSFDPWASAVPLQGEGGISSLAFAPDGQFLVFGDWKGRVWSLPSVGGDRQRIAQFPEPADLLMFSPNGTWLAAIPLYVHDGAVFAVQDGAVKSPVALAADGETIDPRTVVFDEVSRRLVWTSGARAKLLHLGSSEAMALGGADSDVTAARFVEPHTVVIGRNNGDLEVWNVRDRPRLQRGSITHGSKIAAIAPVAPGRFAAASDDGAIRLWDSVAGDDAVAVDLQAPSSGPVQWLSASSDGRWLTALTAAGVKVFPLRLSDLAAAVARTAPPKHHSVGGALRSAVSSTPRAPLERR